MIFGFYTSWPIHTNSCRETETQIRVQWLLRCIPVQINDQRKQEQTHTYTDSVVLLTFEEDRIQVWHQRNKQQCPVQCYMVQGLAKLAGWPHSNNIHHVRHCRPPCSGCLYDFLRLISGNRFVLLNQGQLLNTCAHYSCQEQSEAHWVLWIDTTQHVV